MLRRRSRNHYIMLLVIALAAVGSVAIAYAAMTQVLNVTSNKVTAQVPSCYGSTCSIGFTAGTITGTKGGTSTGTVTCGSATATLTDVTVGNITLTKPDDSCTYAIPITNTYPFAWKITSLTGTVPSGGTGCTATAATASAGATIVCNSSLITYTITTDSAGSTPLKLNQSISAATSSAAGTQNAYLVIKYTGSSTVSTAVNLTNAKFAITYTQT